MTNLQAYEKLAKAIAASHEIPPCQMTDPEIWYSDVTTGVHDFRTAKKFCAMCPVKMQCLEYAIVANETHGIWGGLSYKERRRLALKITPKVRETS